jgi:phytanoyl-CoA hydroxylase
LLSIVSPALIGEPDIRSSMTALERGGGHGRGSGCAPYDPLVSIAAELEPVPRRPHPWNAEFRWTAPSPEAPHLTPAQLDAFDRDGCFVIEDAFGPDEVAALEAELAPFAEEVREFLGLLPGGRLSVAGVDTQVVAPNLVGRSEALRRFCRHPVLLAACADLIGPDVRLYWEQVVDKQPHSAEPVLWHQDNGYTYVEPQSYLTCWIALTDATLDNGCISVVPGAHTGGTLEHRSTDIGEACWGDWDRAVDLPVRAGSVVVFSSLTPHATRRNTTDAVRKAYIVQYVPDGAVARDGDPADGPGTTRRLDDPILNPVVLRGGRPVDDRTERAG